MCPRRNLIALGYERYLAKNEEGYTCTVVPKESTLKAEARSLVFSSPALANPIIARSELHQFNGSHIKWERCDLKAEALGNLLTLGQDRNYPIECATLPVPLDYTNPGSNEKFNVELLRSPARNSPSRDSILLNFGGPGASGVPHLVLHAPVIHRYTGGYHDLVVFKPRSIGEYVGTTFVARDMTQIVDALGEDGLLRYWGISYGSILGGTVATMFPERIDRLICDGVGNVFNYYNRMPIDSNYYLGADEKYRAVLHECLAAGPDKCPLGKDVERKTTSRPQQSSVTGRSNRITLAQTSQLPDQAEVVLGRGREETLKKLVEQLGLFDIEANIAIVCGDQTGIQARPETLNGVLPQAQVATNNSQFLGYKTALSSALCKDWPFESKEKFNTSVLLVDGGVQTRKPGLFIGNTYDILTPLLNAKNMSSYFAGSAVLEQKGFGHGISDDSSKCTLEAVKGYIMEGKLPRNNTVCKEDERLFKKICSESSHRGVGLVLPLLLSMAVAVYHL
ncbi:TAP-like domain containing protein [Rhypophila sp. PSN 637]